MGKKLDESSKKSGIDRFRVTFSAFNESNERILVHIYTDGEENAMKFLSALVSYDVTYESYANPVCEISARGKENA